MKKYIQLKINRYSSSAIKSDIPNLNVKVLRTRHYVLVDRV